MKRLILLAALAAGLTLSVLAQAAAPQPIYFWGSVASTISAPGQPALPEVIRPAAILLAADGSADVEHLHWTGWGSSAAHATGIRSASNGIPNMAQGKRIKKPAQVTLSSPGPFQGHEVYRCFTLTVDHAAAGERLCLGGRKGYWGLGETSPSGTTTQPTTAAGGGGPPCTLAAVRAGFTNGFTSSNPPKCSGLYALAFGTSHGADFVDMLHWNGTAWAEIRNRTATCDSGNVPSSLRSFGCESG
jgi:hypothetical protein